MVHFAGDRTFRSLAAYRKLTRLCITWDSPAISIACRQRHVVRKNVAAWQHEPDEGAFRRLMLMGAQPVLNTKCRFGRMSALPHYALPLRVLAEHQPISAQALLAD